MTLLEISKFINEFIIQNSPVLNNFQNFRRKSKSKQRGSNLFFPLKPYGKDYTFHYGGRSEMQFNIGEDNSFFRYGLAFSLEPSKSYPEIENALKKSIIKYNEFITNNFERFKNLKIWLWDSNERSDIKIVSEIPESWIKKGNFIFIGDYFEKGINSINQSDIEIIVEQFETIFEIYKYVELKSKKIAKICWNDQGWLKPSGQNGKSKDKNSYENIYAFGHEEWLFDFEKIIDGYHYAALQPIGKYQSKYAECFFDILLYTYNSDTKKWYWVGWLNNVQAISEHEAEFVFKTYEKNGWLKEMKNDLKNVDAISSELDSINQDTFNIKFYPNDLITFREGLKIFNKKDKISHTRYTLLNFDKMQTISESITTFNIIHNSNDSMNIEKYTRNTKSAKKEYEFIHGKIQDAFFNYLKKYFPNDQISKEASLTGLNRSIDIFHQKQSGELFIYEIKSGNDLNMSIRASIGQMLEYAYYPDRSDIMKLILVTHMRADQEIKNYIKHLNNVFSLRLGYIGFDYINEIVIDSYNYKF